MTEPAPVGIYVHWPYCARICPYCDFNVVRDRGQAEQAALAAAIVNDIENQSALVAPRRLVSVFLGGGTPSLMQPAWAAEIIAEAVKRFAPGADLEVTLEANPTDAETGRFAAFAAAGVNRLSLGVQALDDASLGFLGRNHSAAEAIRAAGAAANVFERLSLDLIYARPGQTPAAWADELRRAADLGAEHLSPYQLTLEPGTPFDRAVRRRAWTTPDADAGAALYETTQQVLEGLGFEAYEVSNHGKGEAARSRHNLIYWRGQEYLGVGPGAHGRLMLQGARTATRAHARVADYIAAVARTGTGWAELEPLDVGAVAEERLLMGLRTVEGVALADLAPLRLGRLGGLSEAGFVRQADGRLYATAAGRPVLDRVIAELAA